VTITKDAVLEGSVIGEKKLIDNHYYAIANKASLTKPKDLNPPQKGQDEFKEKFGISWSEALEKGMVLNAMDGCEKFKCDGDEMEKKWRAAEKDKDGGLVKFGGGFYAGKISA